jgi:hypothetical protein
MWVLKFDGHTEYVDHVDFQAVSFSTKETPDNPKTKGSLKFKNVTLTIENMVAKISQEINHE